MLNKVIRKAGKGTSDKENCKFCKTWLSKIACHGNVNVDMHIVLISKMLPDKFEEKSLNLVVIAVTVLKLFYLKVL